MEILSYGNFDKSHSFRNHSDTSRHKNRQNTHKLSRIDFSALVTCAHFLALIRIFWFFNDFAMYASLDGCFNSLLPYRIKPSLASNLIYSQINEEDVCYRTKADNYII